MNKRTRSEAEREMKFRQARRNNDERRAIYDAIEENIPYVRMIEFSDEMVVRTEHDGDIFRATGLRRSEHFPGIVPELVSEDGDYMLITWLTYGSLLRLLSKVQ